MGSVQSDTSNKTYGWVRDLSDVRDKTITFKNKQYDLIKSKIDLREDMPKVYNQGSLSGCTVSSLCNLFGYVNVNKFDPSRLFLYYNIRNINGCESYDNGASIRNGLKCINRFGLCSEKRWPYQTQYYTTRPQQTCYLKSRYQKSIKYKRLNNTSLRDLKCSLSLDKPFIFGFSVYTSFEDPIAWNPKIDHMPIPNPYKEKLLGGQTGVAVGYSDKRKCFIVQNTLGTKWGLGGYFFMPYRFITSKQCDDFWVMEWITDNIDTQFEYVTPEPIMVENSDESSETKSSETKTETKSSETKKILIRKESDDIISKECILRD